MSIQSSINQGILATAALVSQNPEFQENKKEAAYEKKLEGTLENLKNTGMEKLEEIGKSADEAVQSGNEQLLYDQLERFREMPKRMNEYYKLTNYQLSEAKKHYMEKGDLENYSKYKGELEELPKKKKKFKELYKEDYAKLNHEYNKAQYRNEYNSKYRFEYSGYEETNKELDRAEQIQANTNNYHTMLKNKSKVDVVGERNGK